jgi:hypothetical protein
MGPQSLAREKVMFRYLLMLFAVLPLSASAGQTRVITDIGLTGVSIQAATVVNADANVVWETLTDYNRLASFVPGMTMSRVISAPNAPRKLVEQKGDGGMLALVIPDHVILAVDERPYARIGFRSVSGWVTSMRGEWIISGDRAPVKVGYRAHVVPAIPPPPLLTDDYVQGEIRVRMDAVAREAERRMQLKK